MTLLLPAVLAVSLGAASAPGKLAIIDLDTPPTMIGMGAQVTRSLAAAATREKLTVIPSDDLRTKLGEKKYAELVKCAGKPACVSQSLADFPEITRAVSGSLSIDEKDRNYQLKLSLIDVKGLTVVADVDRLILIASRRFQKDVDQLAGPLLRGEREARGTLVINANVKNAQVTVNGEFVGVAPVKLQLKPGKHEVKVERPKYLPVTRLVDVDPDKTNTTEIRLLLKPGERPDDEEVPALVAKTTPVETQGFRVSAPTLVFGGAAIVAFGVGIGLGVASNSTEQRLLQGFSKSGVYNGTRADALSARSNGLIANISFGVGAAAAIATVVSLIFDIRAVGSPVEVTPVVAPSGGAVLLRGHF